MSADFQRANKLAEKNYISIFKKISFTGFTMAFLDCNKWVIRIRVIEGHFQFENSSKTWDWKSGSNIQEHMFSHQKDTFLVFSQKYSYRQQGVDKHYCHCYNHSAENIFEIYFRIMI